jgi:hypothetical protein
VFPLFNEFDYDEIFGDASGYSVQPEFLQAMHNYWFNSVKP